MSSRSIIPVRRLSPVPSRDDDELVDTGFVSFQYSYTAVSSRDGRAHVQSNKTQFADGKLTREAFEGELEGDAYRQIVEETQRQMMSWFLPWAPRAEKSAQAIDLSACPGTEISGSSTWARTRDLRINRSLRVSATQ